MARLIIAMNIIIIIIIIIIINENKNTFLIYRHLLCLSATPICTSYDLIILNLLNLKSFDFESF